MIDRNREAFKEEARELLTALENDLLGLEENPQDSERIGSIFRAMHTIKGSGAMFGFENIVGFTHNVETAYDLIRSGELPVTKRLIDLTLSACDAISRMIEESSETEHEAGEVERIVGAFREIISAKTRSEEIECERQSTPSPANCETATYRIRFRPHPDIAANGTNPLLLLSELHEMGACRVTTAKTPLPELGEIDPERCYTEWEVVLSTDRGINAIRDVFIFVEDNCELHIEEMGEPTQECSAHKRIGEILVEKGDLSEQELENALRSQRKIGEILVASGAVGRERVQAALAEQEAFKESQRKKGDGQPAASIRVPADRLDSLVNMVGEMVTVQSRLSGIAGDQGQPQLIQVAEEVERLVAELRDVAMSMRMVPIEATFNKYKRVVRDLARELEKDVTLVTRGGETELDRTVIERLNDPLVHLIRNAVDHGVESPETRATRGKTRQGTVTISATHSGAHVLIRIEDDGAGLDAAAIRAKAVERGLIGPDSTLEGGELYSLIFHPGLSTAKEVTSVSGRGVGMDVVKRNIEALQGSVQVESRKGHGAAITLKIPLTLVIIDGLLVSIGRDRFVLPLAAVEECVELMRPPEGEGQNLATIRGELVPYIVLRDQLHIEGAHPDIEQIVAAVIDERRVGFVVDRVIGEHQTVIKSLGRIYRNVEEISGATILGDGRVALILDLAKIAETAERVHAVQMSA